MKIEIHFLILYKHLSILRPDSSENKCKIYILLFFLNFVKLTNFKQHCFIILSFRILTDKIGHQKNITRC